MPPEHEHAVVTGEPTPRQPATAEESGSSMVLTDRRADIDDKMSRVATLLQEVNCEGLLLFEPENLAWLSSGAASRALPDPASAPAVWCNGDQRWLLAANHDAQRLFDEELDGLGFQLKEWPWHWGRDQLIADLCQNRRIACDRPGPSLTYLGEPLARLRRILTPYEKACHKVLGLIVGHALEATCRTLTAGETERTAAGQISHRLMARGAMPIHVGVAADGRAKLYRAFGYTGTPIRRCAVMTATARKFGLMATATRVLSFGTIHEELRKDHNAVCRVTASYLASTWPDAVPREILLAGRHIYLLSGYEHEWLLAPQGHLTGRLPVELSLTPRCEDLFQPGQAVVWSVNCGGSAGGDTYHITETGPQLITPADNWPLKRIRIQGAEFVRPDVLQR
jgi:Xaa-Pro dipeptidase